MFGINSGNGSVNPAAFAERGQAHLKAADRSHGTGGGTLEGGARAADHYCQDHHSPSPFNASEANAIQDMQRLRASAFGK